MPDNTDVQTPAFKRFMADITGATRRWLDEAKSPHWPYVRLLTPTDIKDQLAEVVE